jgi:drug/metabolite transporter (DMT)-like permease
MIGGLLLALVSAALINIGFLLQHRGLRHRAADGTIARLRGAVRDRMWLGGQALGWVGFAAQIVAVAIAPLSLVQAFAAGGLALSVPVAAGLFHQRITRSQIYAVLAIAAGLAVLPIGYSTARDQLHPGVLIAVVAVGAVGGSLVARHRAPWAKAVAAGIFYGLADASIKAVSLDWRSHGASALLSGWTVAAAIGTFCGFLAFQAALAQDGAVSAISLMNALAALVALACGLLAFGESLGSSPGAVLAHLVAIAVVLAGVPVLAAAQMAIAQSADGRAERPGPRASSLPAVDRPG